MRVRVRVRVRACVLLCTCSSSHHVRGRNWGHGRAGDANVSREGSAHGGNAYNGGFASPGGGSGNRSRPGSMHGGTNFAPIAEGEESKDAR